tara:strand:+ start:190 stop:432 length:243 start_codon:yes stop_codon:yes gene_type:complete
MLKNKLRRILKMQHKKIQNLQILRTKINTILAESEQGKFKNACSGVKDCKNKTVFKWQSHNDFLYFCRECIDLKRTELPI